jgi:hypothetical protein
MSLMVAVWGKAVIESPAAGANPINNTVIHKKIQYSVYSYTINTAAPFKGIENILG